MPDVPEGSAAKAQIDDVNNVTSFKEWLEDNMVQTNVKTAEWPSMAKTAMMVPMPIMKLSAVKQMYNETLTNHSAEINDRECETLLRQNGVEVRKLFRRDADHWNQRNTVFLREK